ncbi:hypothetical protein ACGFYV_01975 [Streptomyces sp. NPDC048297]|uniref:hypothetical protein n=1 Tax=Streptomyces sp. NPDC048297 TaxID=3365531 RepID=UPI00371E776A
MTTTRRGLRVRSVRRARGVVQGAQRVDPGEGGAGQAAGGAGQAAGRGAGRDDGAVGGHRTAVVQEQGAAAGVETAGADTEQPLGVESGCLVGVGEGDPVLVGAAGQEVSVAKSCGDGGGRYGGERHGHG